jgi:hypothetical protein
VAMCSRCEGGGCIMHRCTLILHGVAVRGHFDGMEANTSFTEWKPELQSQERVSVRQRRQPCRGWQEH